MTTSPHTAVKPLAQRVLEIGYDDLPARDCREATADEWISGNASTTINSST
jgi:hypothetical protein